MEWKEIVEKRIKETGKTMKEIAQITDIPYRTLQDWKAGKREPENIKKWAFINKTDKIITKYEIRIYTPYSINEEIIGFFKFEIDAENYLFTNYRVKEKLPNGKFKEHPKKIACIKNQENIIIHIYSIEEA